jgi:hypothetical protein
MQCRSRLVLLAILLLSLCLGSAYAVGPAAQAASTAGAAPLPSGQVKVWLQAPRAMAPRYQGKGAATAALNSGAGAPLALAAGDFDEDGVQDLVVGYATSSGGALAIYRGNLDAFAPQSQASFEAIGRGEFPEPFLSNAHVMDVPATPDFLATGDFNGDGHLDIVMGSRANAALLIFFGDGHGHFTQPLALALPGAVTALAAERIDIHSTVADILVSTSGPKPALLVFAGTKLLMSFPMPASVTSFAFGDLDRDQYPDTALVAGGQVMVLHGRDVRSATLGNFNFHLENVGLPLSAVSVDIGSFVFDRDPRSQMAVLSTDGSINIVSRSGLDSRPMSVDEIRSLRRAAVNREPIPLPPLDPNEGWMIAETMPATAGALGSGRPPIMMRTRISDHGSDDVVVFDSGQMHVLARDSASVQGTQSASLGAPLRGEVSLASSSAPVAALRMRVNIDGRPGMVLLNQGQVAPSVMMPLPDPTFTVNRTDDPVPVLPITNACNGIANDCSLREAVLRANATAGTDTVTVPAGTYTLTLARVQNDCTGNHGALSVNDSLNIVGAGQATTIIQAGTTNTNGIDMVMNVNEDLGTANCPLTNATASISNLTMKFGRNHGAVATFDGDGGCMEFDTGTSGNANLAMDHVTLTDCSTTDGNGGGIATFNVTLPGGGTGLATITNSIFQNSSVAEVNTNAAGSGGAIWVSDRARMSMSNSQILNNNANQVNGTGRGVGGGLFIFSAGSGSRQTVVHGTTITGNQASGDGGGIWDTSNLLIDNTGGSTVISGNTAGGNGGGIHYHAASPDVMTLSKVTITGNTATGNGGGIDSGEPSLAHAFTMSFSRLAGNTASAGSNLDNIHTTVTATDNWWGTNTPATTINNTSGGTTTFDPFIALTHTASPGTIKINQSTTLTGSLAQDNHGTAIAASNLDVLIGLSITFNNAVDGSIPQAQPETLGANVQATATFNAGGVAGGGKADATVDQATVTANIVVLEPLQITKNFNPTTVATNTPSTVTFSINNPNVIAVDGSFTDALPGTMVVAATPGVTDTCGGTVTAVAGSTSISFVNASLPVGACTITVKVSSPSDGVFSNSVTISSTAAGTGAQSTSSASLTVINPPTIAKAFGAATIPLNGTTSLTFTISNTNVNSTLNSITFTDSLPSGLVVASTPNLSDTCSGSATAIAGSGTVSLASSSLAPGTSCTVSVDVQGTTSGVKNNSVQASDTTAGAGNTSNALITVVAPPVIIKAFGAASIPVNGSTSLTFTIQNNNTTVALTGVAFSDTLPAGLVISTPNGLTGSCGGGTITATQGTNVISLSGASLAASTPCTFSVNVTGTAAGTQNNTTGNVTSTEGGTGGTASASVDVVAPPSIAKAFGAASIPLNGTTTVTFTLTNPAANTVAESGVAFSDTLTGGLQVASTPGVSNTCGGTVTAAANSTSISLSGGSIATPGNSCTIVVNVTGTASGIVPNTTGAVSSTNGGTGATSNTATLTVAAPPTISKAFGAATIPLNGTTSVTFTINNPNSNVTLNGVAFTDNLPAGLVVAPTPNVSNTCSGSVTATASSSSISLSGGVVNQAASCTLSVDVQGTTAGAKLNTTGAISSTEGGTGTASNTATVTVAAPPTISKVFGAASIPLNGTTSMVFTITNPNTTTALSGISFSDTVPANLRMIGFGSAGDTCNGVTSPGSSTVNYSGIPLAANSSCTLTVTVKGIAAGTALNTTSAITSTEGGTGTTSNTATLTVVAPPTISKAFGATNVALNGTTTVTFTITNPAANTVAESGVAFSDTLTNGLQVASTPGVSNTCGGTVTAAANSTSISLTGGSIATPGATCTIVVNVTGTQSGIVSNTTGAVSSTNGGTGATSNTATLTVASPPTIAKAFGAASIPLNGTTSVTFAINNPNSNVTLNGVAFTDNLPAGLVVSPTPNVSNTCSGAVSATPGASSISLSGGVVNQAASCTLSVDVEGTSAGAKLNTTGAISSTEGGTGTSSNTASLTVDQASTATGVLSSSNPSVFGEPVIFTATVTNTSAGSTGSPTGAVQFVVDGVNFGPPVALAPASGTSSTATSAAIATLSVAGSPHTVAANYVNADGNFINSTGSLAGGQTVTVATTNTAVVSSANPSVFGESVTFTATVVDTSAGSTAQPTGAVQFVVDGVNFGSPVTLTGASSNSSTATSAATTTLSIGGSPHSVSANYVNADGDFTNSTGSLSGGQVVTKADTTTTVNSSAGTITLGDTVTFTATVAANPPGSGTPTGSVVFFDGTTPIAGGILNGSAQATFSTSLLVVGSHSITAIYGGDTSFNASPLSSPATETVNLRGTTTGVVLNPTTVGAGQASTITVTVTDAGASTPPGTPDAFTATGAPATGRTGFASTLFADGLVLVAGGTDAGNAVLNSAEIYSVSGAAFTATGNLNAARTGAVAVLLPTGKILVAGGSSDGTANGALNTAELFDPATGIFTLTGQNMTAARFGMTATLLNTGKVLLAGGGNSGGVLNSAELYDAVTDTFTATGNLNAGRSGASATLLGSGKVLVAGGSSDGTAGGALNSAEVFDPAGAGTFTSVAGANPTLATGRWQPEAALLVSGKVLVAGGENGGGALTSADLYDPAADSFTASTHPMNDARANGTAVALPNGMVLLPGGTTSQAVELYDADNDNFSLTGSLLHHLSGSAATLLNNGQVLVVGLNIDAAPVSDAELYSPSFNPLGTVGFGSSEPTDVFGVPCVLVPSTSAASTCTSTVTPIQVATSPHTITGTYPGDAVHSGSSNSASLTVIPTAPPTIAKAFSQSNVAQNSVVNVSFTIVNPNPAATLTGISFTDALPAGLMVATPNNLNSDCGGTVTAVSGSSSISLSGGTLGPPGPPPIKTKRPTVALAPPASGQCVITVDLLVTGTGTISNTTGPISANESGPGNPSNTASINVVQAPTVNKAFGAASIPLNGTTSLTFNIANPNTSTPLVGIAFSDTLPSGLVVASPNGLTGSCVASSTISATAGSASISLSALNLPAAGSCSFSVNVTGTTAGTKNNTTSAITATFDDGTGLLVPITGGTASASLVVVAPPVIAKAFNPTGIPPNGVSTLTFTITNPSANTVAEAGVAFTDTLPPNLVIATPNGLSGSCGGTVTATAGTGSISLTGGSVAAASTCIFSVNVTSATPAVYTNITGAVTSTNGGTGNTATASLAVGVPPTISKTFGAASVILTGSTSLTFTIHNPGASTLTGIAFTDNLPAGLVVSTPNGLSGACGGTVTAAAGSGSVSLAGGTLAAGGSCTIAVNVTATTTGSKSNTTGVITATESGPGTTSNTAVLAVSDFTISAVPASNTVTAGGSAQYTVTITPNPAPFPASVTLSVTGLPLNTVATLIPNPLPGPINAATNSTLTIITTSNNAALTPPAPVGPHSRTELAMALSLGGFGLLGMVFVGLGGERRRKRLLWMMLGLVLLGVLLAGCGGTVTVGPHQGHGTPPGTYTITVTGTSGGLNHSTTVTLVVN